MRKKVLALILALMLMMGIVPAKAYALTYTQTCGAQPQIIWDYLYQQIGNPYAVAAMMGNFARESGLIPNIASIPVTCSFDAWASYTDAVDNGEYDENFGTNSDPVFYGIAQWGFSRKINLLNFAKSMDGSVGNIYVQLAFLMSELNGPYAYVLAQLKSAENIEDAFYIFFDGFERGVPAARSVGIDKAYAFYNLYAGQTAEQTAVEQNLPEDEDGGLIEAEESAEPAPVDRENTTADEEQTMSDSKIEGDSEAEIQDNTEDESEDQTDRDVITLLQLAEDSNTDIEEPDVEDVESASETESGEVMTYAEDAEDLVIEVEVQAEQEEAEDSNFTEETVSSAIEDHIESVTEAEAQPAAEKLPEPAETKDAVATASSFALAPQPVQPVLSSNALLERLVVVNGELYPFFSTWNFEYTVNVEHNTESLDLHTFTSDAKASVHVMGNNALADGYNEVYVIVTAEDGTCVYYKINVFRSDVSKPELSEKKITVRASKITKFSGLAVRFYEQQSVLSLSIIKKFAEALKYETEILAAASEQFSEGIIRASKTGSDIANIAGASLIVLKNNSVIKTVLDFFRQ